MQRALTRRLLNALGGSNGANRTERIGYGRRSHSSRVTVRSVSNRFGAIALFVLLSVGCSPTPSLPSPTPNSTATSPLGAPTGFRGGVLTGVTLEIPGARIPNDWTRAIQAEGFSIGEGATVRFTSKLLDATCENFPASLPCPNPTDAVLSFHVSALLDFEQVVPVLDEFSGAQMEASVNHAGTGRMDTVVPLDLPPLLLGRHCLLIAALEDDATIIEGQFPDHSNVAIFLLQVGDDGPNFCQPQSVASRVSDLAVDGAVSPCGYPFLTSNPSEYTDDQVTEGSLWAVLPACGEVNSVVFSVDGILQPADSPLGPRVFPVGGGNGAVIPITPPEPSIMRAITVSISPDRDVPHAGYSRPVRVQP